MRQFTQESPVALGTPGLYRPDLERARSLRGGDISQPEPRVRASGAHPQPYIPPLDDDYGRELPMTGVLGVILLIIFSTVALYLIGRSLPWPAILDFIAPTAAQARNAGWVALTEGAGHGF